MRIFIEIDITKPITRGCTINVKGVSHWIPLPNENLPRLCFRCGKITHGLQLCENGGLKFDDGSNQFRAWLRMAKGRKPARGRPGGVVNNIPHPTPSVF